MNKMWTNMFNAWLAKQPMPKNPKAFYRRQRQKVKKGNLAYEVKRFKLRHTNTTFLQTDVSGVLALKQCVTDPSISSDWTNIVNLFDEYYVYGFKAQYTPYYPNDVNATVKYAPLYTCLDLDNTASGSVADINANQNYENNKVHNIFRPWKRFFKLPKYGQYYAGGTVPVIVNRGFMDTAAVSTTGYMYFNAQDLTASKTYGSMTFTFYLKCKARK